jgi:hypothetical protein
MSGIFKSHDHFKDDELLFTQFFRATISVMLLKLLEEIIRVESLFDVFYAEIG